jgi:hypothetical protein
MTIGTYDLWEKKSPPHDQTKVRICELINIQICIFNLIYFQIVRFLKYLTWSSK